MLKFIRSLLPQKPLTLNQALDPLTLNQALDISLAYGYYAVDWSKVA